VQLNKPLTETLTLYNATDAQVAYRIQTTAPKRYVVGPNAGFLGSKESVKVHGSLREPWSAACHMRGSPPRALCVLAVFLVRLEEFPDGLVCKDKFQILSIQVQPSEKTEDVKIYVRAAAFAEPPIRTIAGRTSAHHAVGHRDRL
jgi:hypothetical protein